MAKGYQSEVRNSLPNFENFTSLSLDTAALGAAHYLLKDELIKLRDEINSEAKTNHNTLNTAALKFIDRNKSIPQEKSFEHYHNEKFNYIYPFLLKSYKNAKPAKIANMMFGLEELKMLKRNLDKPEPKRI